MNKYYYTYEIFINDDSSSINHCYYYGKHATSKMPNKYFGSGKIIKAYIKKHGKTKLKKTILSFYKNETELNQAEYNLIKIKKHELKDKCLNIIPGGNGGWTIANTVIWPKRSKKYRSELARKAGLSKQNASLERKKQWHINYVNAYKNMSQEDKDRKYKNVSNSLKRYYRTKKGKKEYLNRKKQNHITNIKSAKIWRQQFYDIFGNTPESFRKYGKLQQVIILFKKIKNLKKEVQKYEISRFMESINFNA